MGVPKARQLKSGNWNIQITIDGERVSITRPTEKEVVAEATYRLALTETGRGTKKNPYESVPTAEIIKTYIEANRYRLSTTSVFDYESIIRNRFKPFMNKPWNAVDWEKAVAYELRNYSAKTVMAAWGLVKTASSAVGLDTGRFKIRKPKTKKEEHAFLTQAQMQKFLHLIYGNKFELACLLGLLSLRKNEIYGLRRKDVDLKDGFIHVCHTRTAPPHSGDYIVSDFPKTSMSNRRIPLILNPRIAELIRGMDCKPDDYLVTETKNALYHYVNKTCEKNGLPKIGVHGLRHTFASICWAKGVPLEVCMLYGGWTSTNTVRNIYQHLDSQVVTQHTLKLAEAFTLDA